MALALDLSWLTPQLALGGAFAPELAPALASEQRIQAVVELRAEQRDDEALLRQHGVELLHLPTRDLCAVSLPSLGDGVAFANRHLEAGRRILIHCQLGIGRSATLALCVLVSRGWGLLEALELAKTRRPCVSPSPAQYEAIAAWLRERGSEPPAFDAFAAIAYRHLRRGAG